MQLVRSHFGCVACVGFAGRRLPDDIDAGPQTNEDKPVPKRTREVCVVVVALMVSQVFAQFRIDPNADVSLRGARNFNTTPPDFGLMVKGPDDVCYLEFTLGNTPAENARLVLHQQDGVINPWTVIVRGAEFSFDEKTFTAHDTGYDWPLVGMFDVTRTQSNPPYFAVCQMELTNWYNAHLGKTVSLLLTRQAQPDGQTGPIFEDREGTKTGDPQTYGPRIEWKPAPPPFERLRTRDVIYGRKHGMALTMDVFKPLRRYNQGAVVMVMSGGWFSAPEMINPEFFLPLLHHGYTVFTVVHGSQPRFTIPEVIEDMHRSIRFIRHHAADYGIDPERIAIVGGSAGGHLALMMGTAGKEGDARAKDPVDRESSRVQAVGCFFPPTDFMNYGTEGRDVLTALEAELAAFKAPFDFVRLDAESRRFLRVEDPQRRLEIAREISPVTHVSPDDAPALVIHGDADKLVPIQQAIAIQQRYEQAGVPFKLVVKEGQAHGWANMTADMATIAGFFNEHMPVRPAQ